MAKHSRAEAKLAEKEAKMAKRNARIQAKLDEKAQKQAAKEDVQKEAAKQKQEKFQNDTLPLNKTLWLICGQYKPQRLYHVIFKDEFKTSGDRQYFLQHWEVVEDIRCQCHGRSIMWGKLHTHMLAMYTHEEAISTFRKKLTKRMNVKHAAKIIPIQKRVAKNCQSVKIETYKHLIDTILYIQTESGTHKKFNHRYSETLNGEYQKNHFLFSTLKSWKWSQVPYMKYLHDKIDSDNKKLEMMQNSKMKEKLQESLNKMQVILNSLTLTWGSPDSYDNADLDNDLEEWLQLCKRVYCNE